jgi:hypothetical protein
VKSPKNIFSMYERHCLISIQVVRGEIHRGAQGAVSLSYLLWQGVCVSFPLSHFERSTLILPWYSLSEILSTGF